MFNGDMAAFWRALDAKSPDDLDVIIDNVMVEIENDPTPEAVLAKLNSELGNFRIGLAVYGPAVTDEQRAEIIHKQLLLLKAFEDDPGTCAYAAANGYVGLDQATLSSATAQLNDASISLALALIDARTRAAKTLPPPIPATEDDYASLFHSLMEEGFTKEDLEVFLAGNSDDLEYCRVAIRYLDKVVGFPGASGRASRFETTQLLLTAPQ